MSTPEERWWSVRAGEYVLGTLRGEDLELFEKILAHDTSMQSEVAGWEQRLAPLNETTAETRPGDHVWPGILERIRAPSDGHVEVTSIRRDIAANDGRAELPDRSSASTRFGAARIWPTLAGLATAASLVLGVLLYQDTNLPGLDALRVDGVAVVLSDESGKPYFLVETDYGDLRVRVTALTPPSLEGGSNFQLWQALPDRSSVRPVALLPNESGLSRTFQLDSLIEGSDLFGVSIEPDGAPTDSGPTGPVVAHGDFLKTRDVQ